MVYSISLINEILSGPFLDLRVCDSVDHYLLIKKLELAGISKVALDLVRSYLSNKWKYTVENGVCSPLPSVTIGVPQGGILSLLLFLIFIDDFFYLSLNSTPYGFGDDTSIFRFSVQVSGNNLSEDILVGSSWKSWK